MERSGYRVNVTLDPEHAARLTRLAEHTHVQEGTLARSLLPAAIEEADLVRLSPAAAPATRFNCRFLLLSATLQRDGVRSSYGGR